MFLNIIFQSTLPVRGATYSTALNRPLNTDFNPRSPCGERPNTEYIILRAHNFNPRSPCGERQRLGIANLSAQIFQSTLPVRGATGGDGANYLFGIGFQSTLPVRGATTTRRRFTAIKEFQSTLPVRGATHHLGYILPRHFNFNPRSPCGERPFAVCCTKMP